MLNYENRSSHKKNLLLNYFGIAISILIFNIWNIPFFSLFWPKYFYIYFIFLAIGWTIHINIGKFVMNKLISKKYNIQVMKRYREHQLCLIFYGFFWLGSACVFNSSQDTLDAIFVQYFLFCFLSNLILMFIYKKKYINIITNTKNQLKNI
jgi:hypothetical protein